MKPPEDPLYQTDPLCTEATVEVTGVFVVPDGRPAVALMPALFYPTGGGQEHDTGRLGEARVLEVFRDESGRILHVLDRPTAPGTYPAQVDRERRLEAMRHHTAQHILSAAFLSVLDLATVSANINTRTPSTIDLQSGVISAQELERVEQAANAVVMDDRPVRSYYVSAEQARKVPFRRPPKVAGRIRVIEVDGFDHSACGGTHCPRTGMIGVIKVLRSERVNRKLRIHFVAGLQALGTVRLLQNAAFKASQLLDSSPQDLVEAVKRLRAEAEALRTGQAALRRRSLADEARQLARSTGPGRGVTVLFRDRPAAEVRQLATELRELEGMAALLATVEKGKVSLVAACHPASGRRADDLLKQALGIFGGHGGGDAQLAQGGGALGKMPLEELEGMLRAVLG